MAVERSPLIPGLPDHVAMLCLLRVPRLHHAHLRAVSIQWNAVLRSAEFYSERKRLGLTDSWLFVTGTDMLRSSQTVCCMFDLTSKRLLWRVFSSSLPQKAGVDGFRFAAIDERLLVIGGCKVAVGKLGDDQLAIFNTVTNEWSEGSSLHIPRCHFASGVINGSLCVAGGYNNAGKVEESMETYSLEKDEWSPGPKMPVALDTIESDVVFQGKLYVRGFVLNREDPIVLVYDPVSGSWEINESMSCASLDDGDLVATDHGLYNLSISDTLQKFNEETMNWQQIGQLGQTGNASFNVNAPRAFGLGKQIFVLIGAMAGPSPDLCIEGVACHNLFLGLPWHRAGTIIQA